MLGALVSTGSSTSVWGPMFKFVPNPNLMQELEVDLDDAMLVAAEASSDKLRERVGRSYQARTGRKYDKYPRVSSALGEYPQEQFGTLQASVDSVRVASSEYAVGFFNEDQEKLQYLEYTGKGKRRPLFMHFEGPDSSETLDLMANAIAGSR